MNEIGCRIEELVEIVDRLRGPNGCPWDREQTNQSLMPYFIEEVYEVLESVDENNWDSLKEELGDTLLHIIFQALIAEEDKKFKFVDTIKNVNNKLIDRHPHVFGEKKKDAVFNAKQNWESVKYKEKGRKSRLDGVPKSLPSLIKAQRLQQKASYVGFDWDKIDKVWDKVDEEFLELKEAEIIGDNKKIEEEIGDLLFSIVNLSRHFDISAENALRQTNRKFVRRFRKVEEKIKATGKELDEVNLEEMDSMWNQIKHNE